MKSILDRDKITLIERYIGLKRLNVADVLHIDWTRFCDWYSSEDKYFYGEDSLKINRLYNLAKFWDNKNLGCLPSKFLHMPLKGESEPLYRLLSWEPVDYLGIKEFLDTIAVLYSDEQKLVVNHLSHGERTND